MQNVERPPIIPKGVDVAHNRGFRRIEVLRCEISKHRSGIVTGVEELQGKAFSGVAGMRGPETVNKSPDRQGEKSLLSQSGRHGYLSRPAHGPASPHRGTNCPAADFFL
jgi:hypothetical protein